MNILRTLTLAWIGLAALGPPATAQTEPKPAAKPAPPDAGAVESILRRMGDDDVETREAASAEFFDLYSSGLESTIAANAAKWKDLLKDPEIDARLNKLRLLGKPKLLAEKLSAKCLKEAPYLPELAYFPDPKAPHIESSDFMHACEKKDILIVLDAMFEAMAMPDRERDPRVILARYVITIVEEYPNPKEDSARILRWLKDTDTEIAAMALDYLRGQKPELSLDAVPQIERILNGKHRFRTSGGFPFDFEGAQFGALGALGYLRPDAATAARAAECLDRPGYIKRVALGVLKNLAPHAGPYREKVARFLRPEAPDGLKDTAAATLEAIDKAAE